MIWFVIAHVFSTLIAWLSIGRLSAQEKDLELLLLRQQVLLLRRKLDQPVRPSRVEKLTLAILVVKLKTLQYGSVAQLRQILHIVQPETVLKWHRELVRRKWAAYPARRCGGRPRTKHEVTALILRFVQENADWGYGKLKGELHKLGYSLSKQTIANILARHGMVPAPKRRASLSWTHLMQHYKAQIVACDFFTVETLLLKTVYVLFFIELGSRRVHVAGCTTQPTSAWVTQQARQIVWNLETRTPPVEFLIHDRDTKFSAAFDTVFQAMNMRIIRTPVCAPNANAFAERWIRTVRQECLDKLIVMNETHLRNILQEYVAYYNTARPHQGLHQQTPLPYSPPDTTSKIHSRKILGGIINDYYRAA